MKEKFVESVPFDQRRKRVDHPALNGEKGMMFSAEFFVLIDNSDFDGFEFGGINMSKGRFTCAGGNNRCKHASEPYPSYMDSTEHSEIFEMFEEIIEGDHE